MEVRGHIFALCALMAVCATSAGCMSNTESAVTDVSPKDWNSPAEMVYTNRDTLSERRPVLFLRHDQRTRNGRYAVQFRAPSGKIVSRDTISVETHKADSYSISLPPTVSISISMNWKMSYLERSRLAEEGDYAITVTPLQSTAGVWSVGIVLNKSKQNGQR